MQTELNAGIGEAHSDIRDHVLVLGMYGMRQEGCDVLHTSNSVNSRGVSSEGSV